MTKQQQINQAINLALRYGMYDGDHHKMWVIDQMVRILAGDRYNTLVEEYTTVDDGDGECYTDWDTGIPP